MAEVVIVRECLHGQVRVLFGDLPSVEGDIMVVPANNRLAGREGLDEKMQQAAGPELREFCAVSQESVASRTFSHAASARL